MTIKIIKTEPNIGLVEEKQCLKCRVTFQFDASDLREGSHIDWLGMLPREPGEDPKSDWGFYYVICPKCYNEVYVKRRL